jgi:hypothetical protein
MGRGWAWSAAVKNTKAAVQLERNRRQFAVQAKREAGSVVMLGTLSN